MEGLNLNDLTGSEAGQALRKIMGAKGRIFCVTPLHKGETIWFFVGDRFCSIRTDGIEEPHQYVGQDGTTDPVAAFIESLRLELDTVRAQGLLPSLGSSVESLLAIPV